MSNIFKSNCCLKRGGKLVLVSIVFAGCLISANIVMAAGDNLILNPSLETESSDNPANWSSNSWGTNTANFTYPVSGYEGAKAAKVTMTSHTNGDAKWYFSDVAVVPGKEYTFSDYYLSSVETEMDIRYQLTNGSYQYIGLERLPASAVWKKYEHTFTIPANVVSLTFFHLIDEVGELTVDNFYLNGEQAPAVNNQVFINSKQLLAMQANGHEIGSHTQTHPDLTTIPISQAQAEIMGAKNDLLSMGISPVNTFAYPYGEYNADVQQLVSEAGHTGARGVENGYNLKNTDKYALKIQEMNVNTNMVQVRNWINTALADKTWLILMFHKIDQSGYEYGTTPEMFQEIVDYIVAANSSVITVEQGLQLMSP